MTRKQKPTEGSHYRLIVPCIYDSTNKYYMDWIIAKKGNYIVFLDRFGREAVDRAFEKVVRTRNGLAKVFSEGKWGFIDLNTGVICEPIYDDIRIFDDLFYCRSSTAYSGPIRHPNPIESAT